MDDNSNLESGEKNKKGGDSYSGGDSDRVHSNINITFMALTSLCIEADKILANIKLNHQLKKKH